MGASHVTVSPAGAAVLVANPWGSRSAWRVPEGPRTPAWAQCLALSSTEVQGGDTRQNAIVLIAPDGSIRQGGLSGVAARIVDDELVVLGVGYREVVGDQEVREAYVVAVALPRDLSQ